ncbi:hypothetical protein GALL_396970 [mine drainage metagenome]|uniref:Uncharacterized protein n=1 Tax=mine drainage metagenome TaxID=410659 RepID=A0A1J5Q4I8_9ZZZZ
MADLAPKADGIAAHLGLVGTAGFGDLSCEAEVAHAVGGFGQLAQETARRLKRCVDIPQRAGTAETGKLQTRGRVAFGDGAGLIYTHEKERNAFRTGPLQGRKAVRDLLDRGAEAIGEPLKIVAHLLRRGQKRAVRQQCGAREIVGQPDLGDGARLVRAETREVERRLQQVILG